MKKLFLPLLLISLIAVLAACAGADEPSAPDSEYVDAVTLPAPIETPDDDSAQPSEEEQDAAEPPAPSDEQNEDVEHTGGRLAIATPSGPAALGLLYLMEQGQNGNTINDYTFNVVGSPDEIPPLLMRGAVDIAAVPPNLASILYNNPEIDIQAIAVTTMGVLHIVDTTGTINTVEDLRGRTIYSSGGGGMPEFILNNILLGNGLTPGVDVTIEFRPEHTEIAALLESEMAEIAMLPEPFATATVNRVENLEYALDLTEEWDNISPDAGLVMTAVIARREILENYPEVIEIFMQEYAESILFAQENLDEAAELAVEHGIIPAVPVARAAIPRSNLVFITGEQMQRYLDEVLNVFYNQVSQSIGGQMPDADFYFHN